jgi:hypothetical protein
MDKVDNKSAENKILPQHELLPYERPGLLDVGKISDVTLSNGNDMGGDGGYS